MALQQDVILTRGEVVLAVDIMQSCYIYSARNFLIGGTWEVAAAIAQAGIYDYYWFIDSDIGGYDLPMLLDMLHVGERVVHVPYPDRADPEKYVCGLFNFSTGGEKTLVWPFHQDTVSKYRNCDWAGMGCCLFHKSIFTDRVSFPWFKPETIRYTSNGKKYAEVVGEDISICRELVFNGITLYSMHERSLIHSKDELQEQKIFIKDTI